MVCVMNGLTASLTHNHNEVIPSLLIQRSARITYRCIKVINEKDVKTRRHILQGSFSKFKFSATALMLVYCHLVPLCFIKG